MLTLADHFPKKKLLLTISLKKKLLLTISLKKKTLADHFPQIRISVTTYQGNS
jgi:hypothetical protein